ncbi:MAG: HAD family hydrolase [Muribaculaceae bacterium]
MNAATSQRRRMVVTFDLDDTLYKEIDFLRSGYSAVASWLRERYSSLPPTLLDDMLGAYASGVPAFQRVIDDYHLTDCSVADMLEVYRYHRPDISLAADVEAVLEALARSGCALGIITDGREATQLNKIYALGLERYMAVPGDVVISEVIGSAKPARANYEYFEQRYPGCRYVYVADNPAKDFVAPNAMGWGTVALLDDGRNIHPQRLSSAEPDYRPQHEMASFDALPFLLSRL